MTKAKLFAFMQYLLPQHGLSRLVGKLASTEVVWIKNLLIKFFIKRFKIDMQEALAERPSDYKNFNAFFTRALKPNARQILADSHELVSPADGLVSELGKITSGKLIQAKGRDYSLVTLLGGDADLAEPFLEGSFATIYLSPKDYHRVHFPLRARLEQSVYVPGQLFSVNQATADNIPNLFARNERLVAFFSTPAGPMAMVLVGAMIVAGIETVWGGDEAPFKREVKLRDFTQEVERYYEQGDEMGRFKLGSTVILLFGKDAVNWQEKLAAGSPLKMGQVIGELAKHSAANPSTDSKTASTDKAADVEAVAQEDVAATETKEKTEAVAEVVADKSNSLNLEKPMAKA